ncbi:MAG: PKD domain-containing protein, partial [Flavobacteriales bacterium]
DKEWSEVLAFEHNGTGFSTMAPAFNTDGRSLYFASDRPGGFGGMDLYVSRRGPEGWSVPKNLGHEVNSASNEVFPSIGAQGQLYFSSDRAGGLGQLDIYTSSVEFGEFSLPVALPAPLNSTGADLGYAAYADGGSGYFSSNRDGRDRIYRFTQKPAPFRNCVEQEAISYCFHFEDVGSTGTDSLPLRYEWDFGDGTTSRGLSANHCYTDNGIYTVKLNLIDTLSQSIYFNQVSYDLEVLDEEQAYINAPDSISIGGPVVMDTRHTNLPAFIPVETHWDLGDGSVATGEQVDHAYAQIGSYTVRLDLIGGPDGKGGYENHCVFRTVHVIHGPVDASPAYSNAAPGGKPGSRGFLYNELPFDNANLGSVRNEDVTYSVQLLASKDRLGLDDARFIPVRPYYAITERFMPVAREYTYSIGSGKAPSSVYNAYQLARRSGFEESVVKSLKVDKDLDLVQAESLPVEALNNGALKFSTIRFRTGASSFDTSFNATLDRVVAILQKYPELDLVIEAHTDAVGDANTNMTLSQARAQAITDHFTRHGIATARLVPIGYGKDKPVADNTSEAGRAKNRRVEFHLSVRDVPIVPTP